MANLPPWPFGLPTVPLAPAGSGDMFQDPIETEMEDGPARARRSARATWTGISFSYVLTAEQFAVWEEFVRDTLEHGAKRFMLPVWRPGARLPLPLRMARISGGKPSWRPSGPRVIVTMPLRILDY